MHFVIFEEDKKKKTVQHVDLYEKQNDVMLRKMKPMCILQGFDPYLESPPHTQKRKKSKGNTGQGQEEPPLASQKLPDTPEEPASSYFLLQTMSKVSK